MLHQPLDLDGDRLVHLVAHHAPGQRARPLCFRRPALLRPGILHLRFLHLGFLQLGFLHLGFRHFGLSCAHVCLPPRLAACVSRCTVFRRAMLRRTLPNWSGLGACPVARCMRRANCSLRSFTSSSASSTGDLLRSSLASIYRTCRFTKEVDTDSFEPASRNASRAVTSSTPSISNNTLPGCTRAT